MDTEGEDEKDSAQIDTNDVKKPKGKTPKDWLTDLSFYIHGGIYMFVRLAMNLSMTVIPFYLIHVLDVRDPNEHPDKGIPTIIALVPLVSFIMSTIFSLFVYNRLVNHFGNRLIPLFIGCCVISIGSAPFLFLQPSFRWLVFICASSQGMGLAILLNTSTSIISDVIGNDDTSSAFVYGTYSLFDKFSSGILLTIISVSYYLL